MNDLSSTAALPAAPFPSAPSADSAHAVFVAAGLLLPYLERGRPVDTGALRAAMEAAFGASDASGAWDWKTAYDACEAATVLFLRKYGRALFRKAGSSAAALPLLANPHFSQSGWVCRGPTINAQQSCCGRARPWRRLRGSGR